MQRLSYNETMHRIILPLLACLLLAQPAAAEIYKCRLPGGKTEISNSPCPGGSGTIAVRPDESVPEANRQQAERDVERMRTYVEKRENAQRADAAAERQAQSQRPVTAAAPSRHYGDPDACLRDLATRALEAAQRAQLEAECRSLTKPPEAQVPVYVPVYGVPAQIHPQPVPRHPHPHPSPATDQAFTPPPTMVICAPGKPCKR
ncbi:DUF4124 domain-containing protein [Dechloromonas sp. XY25]|uniref:DUF4124 domain-containing protein n=1 Tax=Dechloromonas hankyongensis TaxID=2908002 RepID=A0ABS9K4X8_9RHOO|nr:DUF4124 domain-containing protein [Dechloromonas hankyongensis]MCG2578224.1 DUF4124 domain-containing protein [Dechloromonas hankyongensis]